MMVSGMELRRFRVITDVIDKRLTQEAAALDLGISARQFRRLLRKVERIGMDGVIHGLVGKPSNHKLNPAMEQRVLELWNSKYRSAGFNFKHFTEKLTEREGLKISKEKVRTLLRSNGAADRPQKKGWKHRKQRARRERFGELLQQDTSPHDWLGTGIVYHCVVVIDDSTSKLLFVKLYEHDGTLPNMEAMRTIILKYGLPMSYYTDAAGWFVVTRHWEGTINRREKKDVYCTQIERALGELGIELIIAGSPQAKGRVERANGTLQDRLIAELKLRSIKTLEAANYYIENEFIKDHNSRFAKEPANIESAFLPFIGKDKLDQILCIRLRSVVMNDNTISKSGKYKIQLLPTPTRQSWVRAPIEVTIKLSGTVELRHEISRELIPHEILKLEIPREFKHPTIRQTEPDIFIWSK
jgi:transposase